MTRLRIGRAEVLGWGAGGVVAERVAVAAPGRVSGLVLYDGRPSRRMQAVLYRELSSIKVRTLVLWGRVDVVEPAGGGRAAAAAQAIERFLG
jgi:pimeloyl-ACP methyl ester carboxylesterase